MRAIMLVLTPLRPTLTSVRYELAAGHPLLPHNAHQARLTDAAKYRLLHWEGLTEADKRRITDRYDRGAKVRVDALMDLLEWMLDPDPKLRPVSMKVVLKHQLLNKNGTLRLVFEFLHAGLETFRYQAVMSQASTSAQPAQVCARV